MIWAVREAFGNAVNCIGVSGSNSVVEYLLPKQKVAGSNPVSRSKANPLVGTGGILSPARGA